MPHKPFALKPSYANGDSNHIDAYGAYDERGLKGAENKEAFLKDARMLLRRAVRPFVNEGWIAKISVNRGGVAVSGEVYCSLFLPDAEKMLFIEVSGTVLSLGRETDGAMIMVQYRTNDQRRSFVGGNIYLSADLNEDELFHELVALGAKC